MRIYWFVGGTILVIVLIVLGGFLYYRGSPTFYYRNEIKRILPTKEEGQELPEELIIKPGKYFFQGETYELRKEGFYRFQDGERLKNRIVYQNDPWAILSGLSWAEGPWAPKIKNLKPSEAAKKIVDTNLNLSCGNISGTATIILGKESINSRSVMGLNLQYSWDDKEDNGHTMIEVLIENRWVAVDVDNNITFRNGDKRLTLWEFYEKVSQNQPYEIEYLSWDKNGRSENQLRTYYKKMYQVPFIFNGKLFIFTAEGEAKEKAQKYSHWYRYLDRQAWLDKFYSGYGYH